MNLVQIEVVGIGPGDNDLITPEVTNAINRATDIIGYIPYVERIAPREGLKLHASDNRVELDRAEHAFELAMNGAHVVIVSSGDPGVFAMASALFEKLETGHSQWKQIEINIRPGITAMLAASAKIGAPLGHDFCAINLSDNLKSWDVLERRIRMAVRGDFAMGLYNPRSKSRPHQFRKCIEIMQEETDIDLLVGLARNVSRPDESYIITSLSQVKDEQVDMRTIVLIGNSQTRQISGTSYVYSPRKML